MSRARYCALAALVWLSACNSDIPTELVLVVDTDSAPSVMDTFTIVVKGPSAAEQTITVPYEGAPRSIGLVPATSVLGPVEVTVTGSSSALPTGPVATRVVHTQFQDSVSRVLHIRLSVDCLGRTCTDTAETCDTNGACVSVNVDPTTLPSYLGTVSVPELCNGVDDDGDGRADEDFDLGSDPRHCGACNAACKAGALCMDSVCDSSPIIQVSAGASHTCALRAGGGVACWGSNTFGELGDGTNTARLRPVTVRDISDAVSINAGYGITCAVKRDQSVACWGSNVCGESGRALFTNSSVPLPLPGVVGVIETSSGNCHGCARVSSGSVYCWGDNSYGQIGNGTVLADPPTRPSMVMNIANAQSVRVGADHSCVLRSNGAVDCWGKNASGQLGDGLEAPAPIPTRVVGLADLTDSTMRATALASGADFSCVLTSSGARCWGANGSGQLGLPPGEAWNRMTPTLVPGTSGATAISTGSMGCFACVLGAGGVTSCWGCNSASQLGDGTTTARETAVSAGAPSAVAITVGQTHACVLTERGAVWCWGGNASGQLGVGSSLASQSVPEEVTDLRSM